MNEHTDVYTEPFLENQVNFINEQLDKGLYACSFSRKFGCPRLDDVGKVDFSQVKDEVTGVGTIIQDRNHGFDLIKPFPGIKLPNILEEYKRIPLVEGELDPNTKRVTIIYGDDVYTFTNVLPWQCSADIVEEINKELARKQYGIVCWKLTFLPIKEFGKDHPMFDGPVPCISNDHASVLMSGYAYDRVGQLVYCGIVGHKTEINSLRATLGMKKFLTIHKSRRNDMVSSEGKYESIFEYLRDLGCFHGVFIHHKAIPGKWDPEDSFCYALVFIGVEDAEKALRIAFLNKLQEALDYPLLDEWAEPLYRMATENRFVFEIETGGDCLGGVKIMIDSDWQNLLKQALEEELISI